MLEPRNDVFSFGGVLHEFLAGRRPIRGASNVDVLKAIREGGIADNREFLA